MYLFFQINNFDNKGVSLVLFFSDNVMFCIYE